jgi:hypothetical protein
MIFLRAWLGWMMWTVAGLAAAAVITGVVTMIIEVFTELPPWAWRSAVALAVFLGVTAMLAWTDVYANEKDEGK